jgi:hypothetical protein
MRFDRQSFVVFLLSLCIVVIIGAFFRDAFVRHFLGDVFIVVVICFFVRSLWPVKPWVLVLGTLIFSYGVEVTQYFRLIDLLGWRNSQLAHLTIGSSFDWFDLLAYTIGAGISWAIGYKWMGWGGNKRQRHQL